MSSSTITYNNVNYSVEVNGGSYANEGIVVPTNYVVTNVTFGENGSLDVQGGGLSDNNIFSGINSLLTLEAGASSTQDSLSGGSQANIYGTAWGLSAANGGNISVYANGMLNSGQFGLGSVVTIFAGGQDFNSTVTGNGGAGGSLQVLGATSGITIESGGVEIVGNGGIAYNSVAASKGGLIAGAQGTFSNFQIQANASATLYSGSAFSGGAVAGTLDVNSGVKASGTLTIENGADVTIPLADIATAGSTLGVEILLLATGSLVLAESIGPTQITLNSDGVLIMGSTSITFAGGAGAILNETLVNGNIVLEVPCYVKGTMIAVIEDGIETQVPVESLAEGDEVVTPNGTQIIQLIGKRSYDGKFIANDDMKLPISVQAGALGAGLPTQDLHVSPGHALLIDDVLVQARHLVNGVNITQAASVESVEYFHIGLAKHDVVNANGCWAESFYDDNNINQFQNVSNGLTRRTVSGLPDPMYRPLVHCGERLEKIRQDIAFRAPDLLHGYVDAVTIKEQAKGKKQGVVFINGWAQNRALGQAEVPVRLEIYAIHPKTGDEQKIGEILANMGRKDLSEHFHTSGRHSFQGEFPLPKGISAHNIIVRGAVNGQTIPLTPEALAALPPPPRSTGNRVRKGLENIQALEAAA